MDHHHHYQKSFVGSELSAPLGGLLFQDLANIGSSVHTPSSTQNPPASSMPFLPNQKTHLGFGSIAPFSYVDDGKLVLASQDFNASVLLNNLVFLEQKIHDLQGVMKSMIQYGSHDGLLTRQQMVISDTASITNQLVSTTMKLITSGHQQSIHGNVGSYFNHVPSYLGSLVGSASESVLANLHQSVSETPVVANGGLYFSPPSKPDHQIKYPIFPNQESDPGLVIDLGFTGDKKDREDDGEQDNPSPLSPDSYEVFELEKEEILAPHAHFCLICGKGFKRDANLRMHMRGHGDEYKTPLALAKPNKDVNLGHARPRRYSCPFEGCKRNKKHKKFQPLKTILCVKNHYRRSHCDKSYVCSRCKSKKFSVVADLRTHEKHCGQDKWLCSCGTSFSRKDKLFGHVGLFQGHTPMVLADEGGAMIGNGSSLNVAGETGSERVVFARSGLVNTNMSFDGDAKKGNLQAGMFGAMGMVPQSPVTLMGASFSLHAPVTGDCIQSNGGNHSCGGL